MSTARKDTSKKYIVYIWLLVLSPVLGIITLIGLTTTGLFGELPTFEELENPKSSLASEVYSADLKSLGKYYIQNRVNVHFDDLSPNLVNALKATEDIRFEEHSGVDVRGLLRVFFKTIILQQQSGGGSTLTQQLAKNLFPREDMNKVQLIFRKLKEWIIAAKLERNYTKSEILAMYLNTVEFGNNAFGIKSATTTYFGKTPAEVTIEEASLLIGMLQAPSRYNPVRNKQNALDRRNTVIFQLKKYGFITAEVADSVSALPIKLDFRQESHLEGLAQYFREVLRLELIQWCKEHFKADGTPYNLYRDGLRIYTTIDTRMQRYAEEAVREHYTDLQRSFFESLKGREPWANQPQIITDAMRRSERYRNARSSGKSDSEIQAEFNTRIPMTIFTWNGDLDTTMSPLDSIRYYKLFYQTGFMSMEPQSGYVRAWVGGIDYGHFKYDHVKDGKRQVGSTFKPFVYTLAMQEGYSPCHEVPNVPVTITTPGGRSWTPSNSDGSYGGMLSLKEALANSVNCISAYLMKQFGPGAVIHMSRKMGITSPMDPYPSIALGSADISVYEMVGAYSTFANKGVYTRPQYLLRIEDKNGIVLQDFVPRKMEAISAETAYLMLDLLKGVTQYGTGLRLRGSKYGFTNPIAGKTGTTQNNSDGWFIGITPELVSGVWSGCEDRSVHFRSTALGQGANVALPVWGLYMKKVFSDPDLNYSQGDFEPPEEPLRVELDCSKYKKPVQPNVGSSTFGI